MSVHARSKPFGTPFGRWLDASPLSRDDVARALEVSRAYIWMLAAGKATPSARLAIKIEKWTGGGVPMRSWW